MVWQKIDDQFGVSQKVIRIPRKRRQQVVGLWTLAANYAVRALTDGVLEEHELDELDARDVDVAELVRVGLWHRHGDRCDSPAESCKPAPKGGVSIHDFLVYNRPRDSVAAEREAKQQAGNEGNHQRWHVQRRITVAGCEFCELQKGSHKRSQGDRTRESSANPPVPVPSQSRPGPVPTPGLDMTYEPEVRPVGDVVALRTDNEFEESVRERATAAGVRDLPRLHGLLARAVKPIGPLSPAASVVLIEAITNRATGEVKDVDAYVVAAARNQGDVQGMYAAEDLQWMSERDVRSAS